MKKLLILGGLIFVGTAGWSVGRSLSSDALSMAVGILLGVLAGLPTALLVLASRRRDDDRRVPSSSARGQGQSYGQLPPGYPPQGYPPPGYGQPQPPMIVFAGQQPPQLPAANGYAAPGYPAGQEAWPTERESRRFRVVGEEDGFLE